MKSLDILAKPYNDNKLEFNEDTGRYQLTLAYLKSLREDERIPYRNDSVARRRLKENSQRIYSYIVNHSNTANRQVIYFLLNRTENGRKFLIEVLTAQIESDMEFAINDLVKMPSINGSTGQEGNRDNYRLNQISIETENVIDDSVGYFGLNLCCLAPFNYYLFNLVRQYEGE